MDSYNESIKELEQKKARLYDEIEVLNRCIDKVNELKRTPASDSLPFDYGIV